jgi:RNA polymerase sigma-70 factor (ECF subfamily)
VARAASPASGQARAALDELCRAYWYPIYAFIRRKGNDPERALDLTQDFFLHLIENDVLASAREGKGRFRSFLRTVCHHFLIDAWRKKPAGAKASLSINVRDAEGRYLIEPTDHVTPEHVFDRAWAITLLNRVLSILANQYAQAGKSALFDQLKIVLIDGKGSVRTAELSQRLNMSQNAVEIAKCKLRKDYREILLQQIAATLDDPSDLEDEKRSLLDALALPQPKMLPEDLRAKHQTPPPGHRLQ